MDILGYLPKRLPLSKGHSLGQYDWWGGGGLPTPSSDPRCYKCPDIPPMMLPPQPSYSTCVEVDASRCVPATPTSPFDGPSQVTITVMNPVDGRGVVGANVSVALYDKVADLVGGTILTGTTNGNGQFYFEETAPAPNTQYSWDIMVSPGPVSPGFTPQTIRTEARTVAISNRGTGEPYPSSPIINVCIDGTDSLVCDVADAQRQFQEVYEHQLAAWNYESSGRPPQIARNAADQAHAAVRFTNPRLNANWSTFSWWVGDQAIPAADWPALLDRLGQVTAIFDGIPFPTIDDYFTRCARGIPLNRGMSIANPRFYTDTFNGDYWPKEDWAVEFDMAIQYSINVPAILNCIIHKVSAKTRDVERSAKAWRMMSLASTFILAPLAAGAMPTLLATETAEFGYQAVTGRPAGTEVGPIVTSGVGVLQMDPGALAPAIQLGLERLISQYIEDFDPRVQQVIMAGLSELAAAAAADVLSGIYPAALASGTMNVPALASAGSTVMAVGIQLLGSVIEMQGVRGIESLQDITFDLQQMEDDPLQLLTFQLWAADIISTGVWLELGTQVTEGGITLEEILDVLNGETLPPSLEEETLPPDLDDETTPPDVDAETPLTEFDMEEDIWDPLIEDAEARGISVPRRGETGEVIAIAGASAGGLVLIGLALGLFGK